MMHILRQIGKLQQIDDTIASESGRPQGAARTIHDTAHFVYGTGGPLRAPWLTIVGVFVLLSFALASCGFPGIVSTDAQLPQVNKTPTQAATPPVHFPQDEAPHRDLTEWWYYTGHMDATTSDGKLHHYGFEFVIFQALRSDLPPVYASHFAISDVTRGQFHYDQRRLIEPEAVLPNGTSTSGFNLALGDWTMRGLNGSDHLSAELPNYALHVDLLGLKPPTLHNGDGLITFGLGGFSYYYSRTRMSLAGTLVDHNQTLHVTGEAWMDHQWGNFLALGAGGWDWFSIQLNNFTEIVIYRIRDATNNTTSTYVGYIGPHADNHLLPASALHITVLNHWTSPVTHITYPSGWRLAINSSPLQASLTLIPELKDQELVVYASTGNSYWEGAVSIQGQSAGVAVQGEGYVELTGYVGG
jgi:predicted secreted hydrolase